MREQIQRLKEDESANSTVEALRKEIGNKDDEITSLLERIASSDAKCGCTCQKLMEANRALVVKTIAEEQQWLRIRALVQRFVENVEQSIQQQSLPPNGQPSPPEYAQPPPPPQTEHPSSASGASAPAVAANTLSAPQLPCDDEPTDEYTSSSSSEDEEREPEAVGPLASEL